MKKFLALILAIMMLLSLAACSTQEDPDSDVIITKAPDEPQQETTAPEAADVPAVEEGNYTLTVNGVELIPGAAFDSSALGEAASVYEVPSCAIEGTDNVYNYESFEVTAYDDGTGEVIYSIYFLDPNMTTTEGLAFGDKEEKVIELYGEDYTVDGASYVYSKTDGQLIVILQDGVVISIEYRMIVK